MYTPTVVLSADGEQLITEDDGCSRLLPPSTHLACKGREFWPRLLSQTIYRTTTVKWCKGCTFNCLLLCQDGLCLIYEFPTHTVSVFPQFGHSLVTNEEDVDLPSLRFYAKSIRLTPVVHHEFVTSMTSCLTSGYVGSHNLRN